ncbi:transporter substrate-binding domain-containing protein [Pseudoduganella sp. FT26W]|uniref:Transporter substrate-binding domain-containing protein n=2 Tax=Duganella aquatilis TaxID=2666082 RepID=A0A844D4W7_9BURK|nr:transporter substrate-binding domain-containing protein [Duganella aquatilis]
MRPPPKNRGTMPASRLTFSVVTLSLALTTCAAHAAAPCPAAPLRVAFYETGYLSFGDKGVDRELVAELVRRSGCRIEALTPPRARAYAMLQAGQVDIVTAALVNHQRDSYAFFVPYMQQRFAIVLRRDTAAGIKTANAFAARPALRFGAVRGVNYGGERDQWVARMERERRLEQGASPTTAFRMLGSGRFDAMFAIPLQYEKELADLDMQNRVEIIDWFPDETAPLRTLAFSRKNFSADQLQAWEGVVKSMQKDGFVKRVLEKYLTPKEVAKAVIK